MFTGQFPLPKGKQKYNTGSYACIAPVGGHTCLTAGERSEPAVIDYKRMNVLLAVGGPTATNGNRLNREVRGNNRISSTTYSISSCCESSYGDR